MKRIIILLLFNPFILMAQHHVDIVDIQGATSGQLYQAAQDLFAGTFNSANHITQLNDPVEKKILGKGVTQIEWLICNTPVIMNVYFNIDTQFKDNKCIYDIQSSEIKTSGGESYSYELIKKMGTKEGLKAFYKSKGIPLWIVGKKKFLQNMTSNQELTAKIENHLLGMMNELTLSLKKEIATNN
jgi:hypothetical protein